MEFPGCPVVRTLCSHFPGPGFNPWSRNWDPTSCVVWPKKKEKEKEKKKFQLFGDDEMTKNPIMGEKKENSRWLI